MATLVTLAGADRALAQEPEPSCASELVLPLEDPGASTDDFARLAEITGRAPTRPQLIRRWSSERAVPICEPVPWSVPRKGLDRPLLEVLPVRSQAIVNSGYPTDRNNGALWAGRGLSSALHTGAAVQWGPFSAAVAPTLVYQQNREFIVSPWSPGSIDMPQQFGNTPSLVLDPGQSYARVDAFNVAAGISTENLWLGPGTHYSVLLSNTGPGFTHGFVGTSRPADIWIGNVEAQVIVGRLGESEFFDDNPDNDHRLFTAVVVDYEPRGLPGLFLGAARVFQQNIPPSGLGFGDYLPFLEGPFSGGLDDGGRDELFSFYARWVLPESGFESYFEFGRDDRNVDFHGMLAEPDHTRSYVVGFQKVVETGPRWVRLFGEMVNLENTTTRIHRSTGTYYTHSVVRQGYTHRGQLLGSWTGPGSSAQTLGADLFAGWGRVGLFGERVRRNTNLYYSNRKQLSGYPVRQDVEFTGGLRGLTFFRDFEIGGGLAYSQRRNRGFIPPRESDPGYRVDGNWTLELNLAWRPELSLGPRMTRTQ